MSDEALSAANPLSRAALATQDGLDLVLSVAGRLVGAALAIYIAVDQTYNRTEVLAIGVAVVVLVTFAIGAVTKSAWFPSLGASVLFFGGALLWFDTAGEAMVVAGPVAAVGSLIHTHRVGGRVDAPVSAFFVGCGLTTIGVLALLLAVKG